MFPYKGELAPCTWVDVEGVITKTCPRENFFQLAIKQLYIPISCIFCKSIDFSVNGYLTNSYELCTVPQMGCVNNGKKEY